MTITGELLPRCALPGCANPTDTQGHPGGQCRRDFGPFLRHNPGGQPMTADVHTARDHDVALAYRAQEQLRIDAAAEQHLAIQTGQQEKPGQTCWLCEERRKCALINGQWECRTCRTSTG